MFNIIICFLYFLTLSLAIHAKYTIKKHYIESPQTSIPLGSIIIFEEGEISQAYIEPLFPTFISESDFAKSKAIILTFQDEATKKVFQAVAKNTEGNSEKIIILLSSNNNSVIGFNYAQSRGKNQDIAAEFMSPERGIEHIFKVEPQNKPVQEQSFFQKYKWPLIIGGAIMYLTLNMNPEQTQPQQGSA